MMTQVWLGDSLTADMNSIGVDTAVDMADPDVDMEGIVGMAQTTLGDGSDLLMVQMWDNG